MEFFDLPISADFMHFVLFLKLFYHSCTDLTFIVPLNIEIQSRILQLLKSQPFLLQLKCYISKVMVSWCTVLNICL